MNSLPIAIQHAQLNKKESNQTKTIQPSSPWRLDKALVSHLPVVVVLWSTCWLLTGCDVPGSSLTPEPIQPENELTSQVVRTLRKFDLTVESSDEDFKNFFIAYKAEAIWNRLLSYFNQAEQLIGISIPDNDPDLNKLLSPYTPEEQAELKAGMQTYMQRRVRDFLFTHGFGEVWYILLQAKSNQENSLDLGRMLQGRSAEVKIELLEPILQSIDHHYPNLADHCPNWVELIKQEIAFRDFLSLNKLHEVWRVLEKANNNESDLLDLSGILQKCTPAVQTRVLKDVVQFILNHCPKLVRLNLSNNGLIALPESLGELTQLQRLNLYYNELATLPDSFEKLRQLQILNLNSNNLTTLPDNFGELTQLQVIELNSNKLKSLPESFRELTNLHTLYLSNNQLTALPASFGSLRDLQILNLFGNKLTALPESFRELKKLKVLNLSANRLKRLPPSCYKFINLPGCDVDHRLLECLNEAFRKLLVANALDRVWEKLNQARGKDKLDLSGMLRCNPAQQPHVLEGVVQFICKHCPDLLELDLSDNNLTELPDTFGDLTNLQILNLSDNSLTELPESLENLTNLIIRNTRIHVFTPAEKAFRDLLVANSLDVVWRSLTQAKGQEDLDLPWMLARCDEALQIEVLEGVVRFIYNRLPKLVELNLADNGLNKLPDSFGTLTQLKRLNLNNNQLKELPANFGNLENLNQLNLDNNKLKALPATFGNLKNLRELNLSNNQLTALPDSFVSLIELQRLNLSCNQLKNLTDIFGKLTKLNDINLSHNTNISYKKLT